MALNNLHLQCFGKPDHGLAGDAIEEAIGNRGVQGAFLVDEEHIGTRRLGDVAAVIKHQRILKTLFLGLML